MKYSPNYNLLNRIGCVIVSELVGSSPDRVKPKTIILGWIGLDF